MKRVDDLAKQISSKKAKVGIIGMGYVGKALAGLTTAKGFSTVGFERRQERADKINKMGNKLLSGTIDTNLLKICDVILICVQTPIDEHKQPDLQALENASRTAAKFLRKGQLIIVESSIATGTTRNIVLPILKEAGLTEGKDYFLGYSPERVDPGNKNFNLDDIPKVVSGFDKPSLALTTLFYQQIMKKVVPVSSMETAELTKMFENTFRLINISLVNEMREYAQSWGIDMWEVVNAAGTKPFGFLAHYPGPGVGGHCIPVDPFYIYEDAKKRGITLRMIEEAGRVNDYQPVKVVNRALSIMNSQARTSAPKKGLDFKQAITLQPIRDHLRYAASLIGQKGGLSFKRNKSDRPYRVLLIGLSYKPDIDDVRESPALRIWDLLEKAKCEVWYHDPHIPVIRNTQSKQLHTSVIKKCDMIIVVTNHSSINYTKLAGFGVPILDTRNVFQNGFRKEHIYPL